MPDSVPFWFASRSDYEITDDRVAPGAPLLVIHRFSPQRGSHKSAQGRAERRQPRSAALGYELMDRPAKPACYKIKVRALKSLKDSLK